MIFVFHTSVAPSVRLIVRLESVHTLRLSTDASLIPSPILYASFSTYA